MDDILFVMIILIVITTIIYKSLHRLSNMNPTKNREWTRVLQKGKLAIPAPLVAPIKSVVNNKPNLF